MCLSANAPTISSVKSLVYKGKVGSEKIQNHKFNVQRPKSKKQIKISRGLGVKIIPNSNVNRDFTFIHKSQKYSPNH